MALRHLIAGAALIILSQCASLQDNGDPDQEKVNWDMRFRALPTDYKPTEPFSRKELAHLAAHPRENPRRLMWLINRAGAENDRRFLYLLEHRKALLDQQFPGHTKAIALALAGYEFSLTGNPVALENILDSLAAEPVGSDAGGVLTLAFINEWDRTIAAVRTHFVRTDGAGSMARAHFWWTREYLFPKEFAAWNARSLPATQP
ncbi:MAG: hypothetical protein ACKV19_23200 [Verrucomicrobiales bacterium]